MKRTLSLLVALLMALAMLPAALAETARAAAAAAAIAIEGEETINPAMSADTVRSRMAAE